MLFASKKAGQCAMKLIEESRADRYLRRLLEYENMEGLLAEVGSALPDTFRLEIFSGIGRPSLNRMTPLPD